MRSPCRPWLSLIVIINQGRAFPCTLKVLVMENYWIIEIENNAGRKMYIRGVRPTDYTFERENARHYDDILVKIVSNWLVDIGVSHTLRQFSVP